MERALIEKLADGAYHSGEELGAALGISRAAVWKRLQKLEPLGLVCERAPGRGYCLPGGLDLLDAATIEQHLSAPADSLAVRLVETTESTNTDLLNELQGGATPPLALLAEHQSGGRGRRSRDWVSPYGQALYLSLAWPFTGGAAQLQGLSLAVGTVLAECCHAAGLADVQLKWPNDVLVRGGKLAGILIELAGDMNGDCTAVIGIGLNTSLGASASTAIGQDWTDLSRELGQRPERNNWAAELIQALTAMLALFAEQGFAGLRERWQRFDCCKDEPVRLEVGGHGYAGIARGVSDNGGLIIDTDQGRQYFHGGEVSLRPDRARES